MSSARTDIISKDHKALSSARSRQYITRLLEYLNASVIFAFFMQNGMEIFLGGILRFIFFPAVIAFSLIKLILLLRQAQLENRIQGEINGGTIINVIFEFAIAASIAMSIVGGLVAQAAFSLITPIILITSIAAKAVLDFSKALHYLAKGITQSIHARTQQDELLQIEFFKNMRNNFLSAATTAVIAAAIGVLFFTNLVFIGALGLAVGVVGVTTAGWLRRDRATVTVIEDSTLVEVAEQASPSSTNAIATQLKVKVRQRTAVKIEYGESFYFRKVPVTDFNAPVKHLFQAKSPIVSSTEYNFHGKDAQRTMTTYRPR